jgi:ectoine hydroxylase-related dioxygenase (phytanoyl-CoA dioxygenase family)
MVFLDDSTLENGCLQVLPGSHRLGVAVMRADADDFGNNEMDPRPYAGTSLVPLEVVRDEYVRSRTPRTVVQLWTEQAAARERHPC